MPHTRTWRVVASLAALTTAGLTGASAASNGGLRPAPLQAQHWSQGPITEPFDYPVGSSLAGQTNACGDTWTVVGGTFTITPDGTAVASDSPLVTGTVPLCDSTSVNEEAAGDLHWRGSATFGLLVHAATGGRPSTAALYSNQGAGTVRLVRIGQSGAQTEWARVTGTGGGNSTRFMRLVYVDGVYSVWVNNVQVLTYTVPTQAARSQVEAANAVGIVSLSDNKSWFDNFQAYPR